MGEVAFRVLVHGPSEPPWLRARTLRALGALAVDAVDTPTAAALSAALQACARESSAALLVRAGCSGLEPFSPPPASATARPLCALGAVSDGTDRWAKALSHTGGDLSGLPGTAWEALPLGALWLDGALVPAVAEGLQGGALGPSIARLKRCRVVRYAPLDSALSPGLRVFQVVTSLQQGGAERVTLDLHEALLARGIEATLVVVGRPARRSFTLPEGFLDLSEHRGDPVRAAQEAAREAVAAGADLVHAHLVSADAVRALGATLPTVVTIHNARPGWPEGTDTLRPGDCALLVGCAEAVSRELREALAGAPVRSAWNGVGEPPGGAAEACRDSLGLDRSSWLLNLSNPRPQKALERLAAVLSSLDEGVKLALVGDQRGRTLPAVEALASLEGALEAHGVRDRVLRVDSTDEVGPWLRAADALVTPSAWEGLSLAWLEARAVGLPVVTTAVGGARELAHGDPGVHLVPPGATPEALARAVSQALQAGRSASPRRHCFTVDAMTRRYLGLYRRVLEPVPVGDTVWLVTNNFSVGGAQSSARRLLLGLRRRGLPVHAATLQEHSPRPTRGRRALLAEGVPVEPLPPPEEAPPEASVDALLACMRAHPPRAVLLWNALAEHKLRLVDALVGHRVIDVSPGEMYHASLQRFFAQASLPADLPFTTPEDYGALLEVLVVKHRGEVPEARSLGAPVVVIPNGVPLPAVTAARSGGGPVVFGTSARISSQKRLDLLLDAFERAWRRLPGLSLRVAGGVEAGQEAHALALRERARGLPVQWLGDVEAMDDFLLGLGAFVMVSEPAGCPNASLEAMAHGLPLVVTDVGGAREQVVHGETGLVTPRADPEALAEAMVALASDGALRARLGAASRARCEALFSMERMVDDYQRLLADPYRTTSTQGVGP